MDKQLTDLPKFVSVLEAIKETIITNIVLIGQIPSPTFKEKRRARYFLDRLTEAQADECTMDGYRNPIGIIRGKAKDTAPILVVAHLDTLAPRDVDHNFTVKEDTISGPGVLDNSVGVGVLASLPEIFRKLELRFNSDIVLAGTIQSIGTGNLRGVRHLVKTWASPVRGAVCIEGGAIGRLNYTSLGMIRAEISCSVKTSGDPELVFRPNAILILNEVINQILRLRLPQRPRSRVIIGKIAGGLKHGLIAPEARLGFEIQSDADRMVKRVYHDIRDIVDDISHKYGTEMRLNTISNISAARLPYNHKLVKSAVAVMKTLGIRPVSAPSESELSIFLTHKIPAVTLGITRGEFLSSQHSVIEIAPLFKGIAQVIGVIMAIDQGVCDGKNRMA